jgi:competence protein ComEA
LTAAFCAALAAASLSTAAPQRAGKKGLAPGERLDINRCSAAELMRLPGIGRKRAEAVVAHRARAPYRRVEDLVAVKGISRRWLQKNRAHLTVGAAPTGVAPPSRPRLDARAGAPR